VTEKQLASHFVKIRRAFEVLEKESAKENFLTNKAAETRVNRAEHQVRILCHELGNEATKIVYSAADKCRKQA
jgi:hypothetical protein